MTLERAKHLSFYASIRRNTNPAYNESRLQSLPLIFFDQKAIACVFFLLEIGPYMSVYNTGTYFFPKFHTGT
jgi:hypothetical protein